MKNMFRLLGIGFNDKCSHKLQACMSACVAGLSFSLSRVFKIFLQTFFLVCIVSTKCHTGNFHICTTTSSNISTSNSMNYTHVYTICKSNNYVTKSPSTIHFLIRVIIFLQRLLHKPYTLFMTITTNFSKQMWATQLFIVPTNRQHS